MAPHRRLAAFSTIEDAWFVPLVDIGFEGKGGKYLVLPPDYKGDVPSGYIAVRSKTYNGRLPWSHRPRGQAGAQGAATPLPVFVSHPMLTRLPLP